MKRAQDEMKDALLAEATALAAKRNNPDLVRFVKLLFARGAAEDLVTYTAVELLAFAESGLSSLALRVPGIHSIRIFNPPWDEEGDGRRAVTVIEVINDNMPFLVDSVMQELTDAGLEVRLMVHPILSVARGMTGRLLAITDEDDPDATRESFIHVHVTRLPDPIAAAQIETRLDLVLADVRASVDDWPEMNARLKQVIAEYRTNPPPLPVEEIAEAIEFLTWLADNNFTFLGLREYDVALATGSDDDQIAVKPGTGLGLLRDPDVRVLRRGRELVQVTPEVREFMLRPEPLIVAKANVKARVHRHAYMDYVGVKHYDDEGTLVSELRLLGLFTSSAYTRSTRSIPYLRRKVAQVMERAGFDPESHSGKALHNILESYSRDELFQIDIETLQEFTRSILELIERPRIRVLARREKFNRFVSVLVYVPRDRFNTHVQTRIGAYLKDVYEGRVSAVYPAFPEGPLARVHYIIGRDEGVTPNPSQVDLEAAVTAITHTWADAFQEACRAKFGPARGRVLIETYGNAFPPAYKDTYAPAVAIDDLVTLEHFVAGRQTAIALRSETAGPMITLRHFQTGGSVPLSQRVPILEAMGFSVVEEKTFEIVRGDAHIVLHDMAIERADGQPVDLAAQEGRLTAMYMAVWLKQCESDRLNSLTIAAGLGWREIALLRTLSRYLQQIRVSYDQSYIAEALVRNAGLAARLVDLFHTRFIPHFEGNRAAAEAAIAADIAAALENVPSLDDDRIIRRIRNLIEAATRTTFFQIGKDGAAHPVIAIKFDPREIEGLPEPRPFAEIFLHCPRVEGVHLRFGKVARGGLRWSDRPQDFRTEVLGLVKAQQVKNAVIVPVGAKGGFVPKFLPVGGSRDEVFREGTEAYKLFVNTLLDLTDNIVGDAIIPPVHTVRHDGDDPYLVVAADKGTATFSDTANGLADAHGFWLSDAFASGGSVGYDHKKMGITARGAWEAVKRHFREMNVDIQSTPFTVAGVGDMSGDVFGNGMLLSPAIKLQAAFDHRDIFLDPNPDLVLSFAERQRLFGLARSSWADYDRSRISAGGGVFSRQLKSIPLSSEVQALLGLTADHATPQEVMTAILKAEVDLLWFGGIGTYVKAADESDAEVGDRANDAIRVNATDLRAKVIGEGANLGVTQKARIAYGLAGGRCNSDAVDNSAGVNSSDVEVNIKIALGRAVRAGRLPIAERNSLLAAMTPEVARLVLSNNYRQTLAVSVTHHAGAPATPGLAELMRTLEVRGKLDRKVEFLPDEVSLARRMAAGEALSRGEIGVLMAYAKIVLFDDLIASDVPDMPSLEGALLAYFPADMREGFAEDIRNHRLKREIIATGLANGMINRGGPAFVSRLQGQTGATVAEIARAYLAAMHLFNVGDLEAGLDALDGKVDGSLQLDLYAALQDFLGDAVLWILRNGVTADRLADGLTAYRKVLGATGGPDGSTLAARGLPLDLAQRLLALPLELSSLDTILAAGESGWPIEAVVPVVAAIDEALGLQAFDRAVRRFRTNDPVEARAMDLVRRSLSRSRRALAVKAVEAGGAEVWLDLHAGAVQRARLGLDELLAAGPTVARLTVAAGLVADLA
ncbi:NAD-glutamate dehydrogenase [Oryzibacter oryziterrae]|uniref:NAD-glutamate dehydrogenase n=1 Tax=Oryzibacter oryziterrae TaxID=2766474 RepID=UPI001F416A3A|nr:NAD-glutamate dehydrogenase [Oryzibacter oryziterrae]